MSAGEPGIPGTINALASGTWTRMEGQTVEVIGTKNHGLAALVRVGAKAPIHAGKSCWIPRRWVTCDEPAATKGSERKEPAAVACPACGSQLELVLEVF